MALAYEPINKAHAISEVAVFAEFQPAFGKDDLKKLDRLSDALGDDLPHKSEIKVLAGRVKLGDAGGPEGDFREETHGLELQSFRKDGATDWLLRITDKAVSLHCLDYFRWDGFWEKAQKYLRETFSLLEGTESFVSAIGLKYTDRFIYKGEIESYKASDLFQVVTCPA